MEKRYYSQPGDRIVSTDPVIVSRYRGFTRLNHWVTAFSMIGLGLSGMALFSPHLYFLTGLFGGGQMARWLHPFMGIVLFFSFLLMFVQLWRLNLPRPEDATWVVSPGIVMSGDEEKLPELGKYNAGQKVVFWGMAGLTLVLILTGLMIWEQYFPDAVSIPVRRWALLIHSVAAVVIILAFILHVYAAIWTRGTIRAMTRGTVTGGWAWKHHRKWLREVAGREGRDPAE